MDSYVKAEKQAVLTELKEWKNKCFAVADSFPASLFPSDGLDRSAGAGAMARHVMTNFGIELAGRVEALERELGLADES
jgi:hypothetical protein